MSKLPNAKTVEHQTQARTNGASTEPPQAAPLGPQTVIALQRAAGNRAVGQLLVGGNGHTAPNGNGNGNGNGHSTYLLQRKPANGSGEGALEQQADRVETAVEKEPAAGKALLVEDDVQSVQPGQLHKGEFLSALKTSVCKGADEELKGTIWSSMGCPYVERWFDVYASKDSAAVERALRKYAPETRTVTSAEQYIPLVTEKVRKGVAVWKETGEVTGVPPEFAEGGMPGATFEGLVGAGLSALGGAIGGAVSKAASAVGGAISGAARAVGSGIASVGRALFKAQPGGTSEPQNTDAIQAQLQGGHPLDAEVRGRMESAFGQDFSRVRVHADAGSAHLSQNLNARAFTMGRDVAFGAGEYQPGTLIGDALIAHELAHVVQQGNGKTHGAQTKGAAYDALEEDADVAAVGAVATQFSGAQGTLRDIGREAMPRLRSGLQLQRCSSSKKQVASPKSEAEQGPKPTRFRSAKLLTRDKQLGDASKQLEEVNTWALAQVQTQNIKKEIGPKAVVALDPKQKQNVISVIGTLQAVAPTFETKGLEAVSKNLDESTTHAKAAKKNLGGIDSSNPDASLYQMQLKHELFLANESLDNALKALEATNDSVDGTEIADAVEKARGILSQVSAGKIDQYDGIDAFTNALKKIKEQIRDVRNNSTKAPNSIARIQFVLKSFVAINAPGFAGAPSAAEVKTFRGQLSGNLSEDFKIIFERGGGLHSPFELFETFANILDQQLAVLDKMGQAKKPAKGMVPTQGEAEEFFKALKSKPNNEVFQAYESYAGAFFYHHIVATIDDMKVTNVAELYKRDVSITGLRPLVCSGYAILGADLLQLAGATLIAFVSAVRATDDDILNDTIDSGHAIAHLKRKGQDFFVSNDLIVLKEEDAIGPDAVAWGNSKAPLTKASGPTNAAAQAALERVIGRKKEALEAKPKGKQK